MINRIYIYIYFLISVFWTANPLHAHNLTFSSYPNPFEKQVNFILTAPDDDTITIKIFSKDTVFMDTVFDGIIPKGTQIYDWITTSKLDKDTFLAQLSGNFPTRYILLYQNISNGIKEIKLENRPDQKDYFQILNKKIVFKSDVASQIKEVRIHSLSGQLLYLSKDPLTDIDVSKLPPNGIYFISLALYMPYEGYNTVNFKILIE